MNEVVTLRLEAVSAASRAGILSTPHGEVPTPVFMPVGTLAAVKGLTPAMLREVGATLLLANTYHLALRPGESLVKALGGVAAFMGWHGPTLTDSGGFQVYSLAEIRHLSEEGITFKSHIDGALFSLTPERAMAIQEALGADIMMALDECPPGGASRETVAQATARTHRWAQRCRDAWTTRERQALFGIVQGGIYEDLRRESVEALVELNLPGYAIGGVSVGEAPEEIERIVALTAQLLPSDRPRYLMGVGRPQDILHAIGCGVDMFDCVMPTRHARHGQVFTWQGPLNLRNLRFREDPRPIEEGCDCYTCKTVSRAYVRHLMVAKEMLGPIYAAIHNLRFYLRMMEEARRAILRHDYEQWCREKLALLAHVSAETIRES